MAPRTAPRPRQVTHHAAVLEMHGVASGRHSDTFTLHLRTGEGHIIILNVHMRLGRNSIMLCIGGSTWPHK